MMFPMAFFPVTLAILPVTVAATLPNTLVVILASTLVAILASTTSMMSEWSIKLSEQDLNCVHEALRHFQGKP